MATDLKEELNKIFESLQKKGLVTPSMAEQKDNIVGSLAQTLKDIEPNDLKDPIVQMRMMGAMVCKGIGLHQFAKLFTDSLTKDPTAEPTGKEKMLLSVLKALKMIDPENKLTNKPGSLAEKMIKELKELVMKKRDNTPNKEADNKLSDFDDELSQSLRILQGGKDPRHIDAIASVVLTVAAGEQFNTTKFEAASGPSSSFLEDLVTGVGTEALGGPIDTIAEVNRQIELEQTSDARNTSWPPRPQGPGQMMGG